MVGSFLNVCSYRLPRGMSVVFPPSHCPQCGQRLSPKELIPVLSYFWQRGRCRHCRGKISKRYPVSELVTAGLFTLLYFYFGLTPLLLKYLFLTSVLTVVAFTDLEAYLVPNGVLLVALLGGIVLNFWARDLTLFSALLGLALSFGFFAFLALVSRGGMGGGDAKLAGVIGFFLGWPLAAVAVFLACLFAGLLGIFLLSLKLKGRKDRLPFAPFLAAGALVTIVWGEALLAWYLKII